MLDLALKYGDSVPPSQFSHHGQSCCNLARAWFLAMDRSYYPLNRALPVWVRLRYEWGPARWPMYWCEAIKAEKLDCGGLVAFTLEALGQRGVPAVPCQIVRRFDLGTIAQWRAAWSKEGSASGWAVGDVAYHETCAILDGGRVDVWDPSTNAMVSPDRTTGYGSTAAIRIGAKGSNGLGKFLRWGSLYVLTGRWTVLEEVERVRLAA